MSASMLRVFCCAFEYSKCQDTVCNVFKGTLKKDDNIKMCLDEHDLNKV